ncbi:MAG: adenylate/guanylate cyclase domain-containing protein [Pseudomonadota bacterium]
MSDVSRPPRLPIRWLSDRWVSDPPSESNRYTIAAMERHKREGLELAVRSRWIALLVIAVLLPILNFNWNVLWYEFLLLLMAGVGWVQRRVGRVGRSRPEFAMMVLDVALMTFILTFPNPFSDNTWPDATYYSFGNFLYIFVILASGTLAYSWRTLLAIGAWTALLWMLAALGVHWFGQTSPALSEALQGALGDDPGLLGLLDPNLVKWDIRLQEVVVFMIVAAVLAVSIRRLERLVLSNAVLERERTNLSRYFSPRVVEDLSRNDEPLKEIREHDVAVLFVDIAGFTAFAATRPPQEVIDTLRRFHAMMEAQVFAHEGTLDKFLGDGLMATFGTPLPTPGDPLNAIAALKAMQTDVETWNATRAASDLSPISVRFGLHYGPAVLGDIGATQLEFAVIGNTVNVASRMEALTRDLSASAVISADMHAAVTAAGGAALLEGFVQRPGQEIRGLEGQVTVWTLG